MLALYRSGRQPDALEAFREARRVLSEGSRSSPVPTCVGCGGSSRTTQRSPPSPWRWSVVGACRPRRPRSSAATRRSPTLELLREHRLVTLTGPPGVGKAA